MRDLVSCFSEHAIKVSDTACSSSSAAQPPSIQNTTVSCLYRSTLSTQKRLITTVTWCKNLMGHSITISVLSSDDPSDNPKIIDPNFRPIWKKRGTRSFHSNTAKIDIFWDLTNARYDAGFPEPMDGFYVGVIADSELVLLLGDAYEESHAPIAHFTMVARKEYVFGKIQYSAKARFFDGGPDHDISIKCRGQNGLLREPELFVAIDQKKVVHVQRLHWKFRGNQTIFIDGSPIELMWDVHGWFVNPVSGCAVFLFRERSGLESRLWLEEQLQQPKGGDRIGFSLLIYACRSP
ncbi:hypothetical protein ACLOJK_031240 [Asimina triloba]